MSKSKKRRRVVQEWVKKKKNTASQKGRAKEGSERSSDTG